MIQFFCPSCEQYVPFIGELIPLYEELELYCKNCGKSTATLLLSDMLELEPAAACYFCHEPLVDNDETCTVHELECEPDPIAGCNCSDVCHKRCCSICGSEQD